MTISLKQIDIWTYKYRYRYRNVIYMNFMAATNQKPTIDTQKQRDRNPNITLKKIIRPKGKRLKE